MHTNREREWERIWRVLSLFISATVAKGELVENFRKKEPLPPSTRLSFRASSVCTAHKQYTRVQVSNVCLCIVFSVSFFSFSIRNRQWMQSEWRQIALLALEIRWPLWNINKLKLFVSTQINIQNQQQQTAEQLTRTINCTHSPCCSTLLLLLHFLSVVVFFVVVVGNRSFSCCLHIA